MDSSFDELIDRAMYLGVHQVAYPIDIFGIARLLAEHASDDADFEKYFCWFQIPRTISLVGLPYAPLVSWGPCLLPKHAQRWKPGQGLRIFLSLDKSFTVRWVR
ncbi:hypothetical protein VRB12_20235 [Pseudomonas poae]|uniref:hypothetical protein n=1 Tax=Pseudomonas poae TaxID=200451 RepID=UPI0030D10E20